MACPQRILMTTDVVGGVWDFCVVLASALRARGIDVTLFAFGAPTADQRTTAARLGIELLNARLKLEWMQDCEADLEHARDLIADLARQTRADVIHANQFVAACARVDVPVVLTLHSDVLSWRKWTHALTDLPAEWHTYRDLVCEALRRADSVIAVSAFLAGEIRLLYETGRSIEVVHNGWPAPDHSLAGLRERRHPSVTVTAGRVWDAAKNLSLLAEAARGWDPGDVLLAGEQRHPDSGGSAHVPPPLEALGFVSRKRLDALLRRASVYISPARYDPFGLLPLQAAVNGCALLLSDIPSYREMWNDAALFFRSNDATDLRRHWKRVLEDADLEHQLRAAAHARATTSYTPAAMADAYVRAYARVAHPVAA